MVNELLVTCKCQLLSATLTLVLGVVAGWYAHKWSVKSQYETLFYDRQLTAYETILKSVFEYYHLVSTRQITTLSDVKIQFQKSMGVVYQFSGVVDSRVFDIIFDYGDKIWRCKSDTDVRAVIEKINIGIAVMNTVRDTLNSEKLSEAVQKKIIQTFG